MRPSSRHLTQGQVPLRKARRMTHAMQRRASEGVQDNTAANVSEHGMICQPP